MFSGVNESPPPPPARPPPPATPPPRSEMHEIRVLKAIRSQVVHGEHVAEAESHDESSLIQCAQSPVLSSPCINQ